MHPQQKTNKERSKHWWRGWCYFWGFVVALELILDFAAMGDLIPRVKPPYTTEIEMLLDQGANGLERAAERAIQKF